MQNVPPGMIQGPRKRSRHVVRYIAFATVGILGVIGLLFIALVLWAIQASQQSESAMEAGREFGAGRSDADCLQQAITQFDGGYAGYFGLQETEFLRGCLEASSRTDTFCASDMPLPSNQDASAAWHERQCGHAGIAVEECAGLFWVVQHHCVERAVSVGNSSQGHSQ